MLPERFGRYEVLAEIGDGAMGRVFAAWDPAVSRKVAVKTVKAEYLTPETAPEYRRRFRREAQAAGGLNHPSIVRVFDVGDDYLVMEHVEGKTLQRLIREEGRIAPGAVLRLLSPVAEAVDFAHRAGIVHRDIKPANVIVQPDGRPKLMDFGVAHVQASVMTTAGEILGSPTYMSPEQIAGQEVTARSDVYSLAVVAYEMLTGQPPFQGKTITQIIYRVMHDLPPPPRRWNSTLPSRYDDVFARALAKDPAQRFARAADFVTALDIGEIEHAQSLEATETVPAALPQAPDDSPTLLAPPPREPATGAVLDASRVVLLVILAFGGLGLLVALALAAGLFLRREPGRPTEAPVPPTTIAAPPESPAPPSPEAAASPPSRATPAAPRAARLPTHTPTPEAPPPPPTPAPTAEGQLVELGPGVTPPVRISGGPASYPRRARQRREYGTVAVELIVDETGMPRDLRVVESAGPILDEAVLDAIRTWRFEPARKDGVKVKVPWTVRQTYRAAR
jgi:eukaryotic-like serine/threonine-protein kinase